MQAFFGDAVLQKKIIDRVRMHAELDEIVQGKYWENGKGCAIGCTIHGKDHSKYETKLGIPVMVAHLEDAIFELLPLDKAKDFPLQFITSIPLAADLARAPFFFLHWLLIDPQHGVIQFSREEDQSVISQVSEICWDLAHGRNVTPRRLKAAAGAAGAAAEAAAQAAGAAEAAAQTAEAAAWAAAQAAEAAAWAARAAGAARAAWAEAMRDKLLSLLTQAT